MPDEIIRVLATQTATILNLLLVKEVFTEEEYNGYLKTIQQKTDEIFEAQKQKMR